MGTGERDHPEEPPEVVDLASAYEYVNEALPHIHALLDLVMDHWQAFLEVASEHEGRVVLESDPDAAELATKLFGHIYAMSKGLPLLSVGAAETARVIFEWIAPPEMRQQLVIDKLQEFTGAPWKVTELGPFKVFSVEDVKVPDDLSELDHWEGHPDE